MSPWEPTGCGRRDLQWPSGFQLSWFGAWWHHWPSHWKQQGREKVQGLEAEKLNLEHWVNGRWRKNQNTGEQRHLSKVRQKRQEVCGQRDTRGDKKEWSKETNVERWAGRRFCSAVPSAAPSPGHQGHKQVAHGGTETPRPQSMPTWRWTFLFSPTWLLTYIWFSHRIQAQCVCYKESRGTRLPPDTERQSPTLATATQKPKRNQSPLHRKCRMGHHK